MKLERAEAVTFLRMQAGKANAIGDGWLERMNELLDELDRNRPGALVVTGHERHFCAGLDLPSLVNRNREEIARFIARFNGTMLRIFSLPIPVVAAVNGHAIAGGCVLALQADYRILLDEDHKIGLNEAQLGLGLPVMVFESLRCQVSPQVLESIALEGRLFSAREALNVGLVHEVVARDRLEARALEKAKALAALPQAAYAHIKRSMRQPTIDLARQAEGHEAVWAETFFSESTQANLRALVARLQSKKS